MPNDTQTDNNQHTDPDVSETPIRYLARLSSAKAGSHPSLQDVTPYWLEQWLLRLFLIAFTPVSIFAMYQWTLKDLWLSVLSPFYVLGGRRIPLLLPASYRSPCDGGVRIIFLLVIGVGFFVRTKLEEQTFWLLTWQLPESFALDYLSALWKQSAWALSPAW
ncbi:hypothetical protein EDC04DRAFT_2599795 [Pisolithus marmoratus]|nr:hypothetical protein EDC04DRAFT_2599795 [Pisolithus marmoratus]